MSGRDSRGMGQVGAVRPLLAQPADRVDDDLRLLDRVDGAALTPVRLEDLRVPRPARHGDLGVARRAAGNPDVEPRRLGHDARVGLHAVQDESEAAGARRFLVGVGRDEQIAREPNPEPGQHFGREDHAGDTALHVARSATVQLAVADLGLQRVARPLVERLVGDRVDVAVEEQALAAAGTRETGDELRASLEPHAGRIQRLAGEIGAVRLEELDVGTRRTKPPGKVILERLLLARRVFGDSGGRVEADQRGGEGDELVLAARYLGDDLLLGLGKCHGPNLSLSRYGPAVDPPRVGGVDRQRVADEAPRFSALEERGELIDGRLRIDPDVEVDLRLDERVEPVRVTARDGPVHGGPPGDLRPARVVPEALQRAASDRDEEQVLRGPRGRKLDRCVAFRVDDAVLLDGGNTFEPLGPHPVHGAAP